jgi:hypothetical protein
LHRRLLQSGQTSFKFGLLESAGIWKTVEN